MRSVSVLVQASCRTRNFWRSSYVQAAGIIPPWTWQASFWPLAARVTVCWGFAPFLNDFMKIKGVGKVKGIQLLCIGELSRRIWKKQTGINRISFEHPSQISDYYMEDMRHLEQEEIRVMFLNTKQGLIKDLLISRGTVNASVMTPREILIEALRCCAVSMVLVHNHPSGDPSPSRADLMLTERVKEAGVLIGITLIDHIIIGDRQYLSFREQKIL